MRKLQLWLALLLGSLLYSTAAQASGAICALLSEVGVINESVYLSDLLPMQAPPEVRASAGKIRLADAPPPGGTVTLAGDRIARLVPAAEREEIRIPAEVVVHRSGRLLTRAEVVKALRHALVSNQIPGASSLEPDDVHFSAPIHVSGTDARLEVRRIDLDPALKQARFLLASRAEQRSLPFLVTAELRADPADSASGQATAISMPGDISHATVESHSEAALGGISSLGVSLVEPRRMAQLHVASGNMQMFLDVFPLEKGALHETVRVRIPGSGKVLRGQVVAADRLEAQF